MSTWFKYFTECASTPSACEIPISHRLSTTPTTAHYANYRSWAAGDTKLDWQGAESGQGVVDRRAAGGSPAVWTTNQQSNTAAYRSLNRLILANFTALSKHRRALSNHLLLVEIYRRRHHNVQMHLGVYLDIDMSMDSHTGLTLIEYSRSSCSYGPRK